MNAGATIIDIGGESTRPGAAEAASPNRKQRVVPVAGRSLDESKSRFRWIPPSPSDA
ncbi:dihydropteroate synthase [Shigella flexneri]